MPDMLVCLLNIPERELLLAQVYRWLNEVYFRTELVKKGLGTKEALESSIAALLAQADYIEKRFGPDVRMVCTFKPRGFIVKRIRAFVEEARADAGKADAGP